MRRLGLGLLLALAACRPAATTVPATTAPPAPPPADAAVAEPAPPKDPVPVAVEQNVRLYEDIAALDPATPCPEAAVTIERLVAARTADLQLVRRAARSERRSEIDGQLAAAADRLGAAVARIDALAARCAGEPAVAAALSRMARPEGE